MADAHTLHRLARSPQRAGDEIERLRIGDQLGKPAAVAVGLGAAKLGDVGVGLPLKPGFRVPGGLAMTHEIKQRGHGSFNSPRSARTMRWF